MGRVNAGLRYYIKKCGVAQPDVTQRLKRLSTIIHKLERHPGMVLTRMEDIGGVRVVVPTQRQALDVATMLQGAQRWKLRRERLYIDGAAPGPKDDGYRAIHLIIDKDGCYVEIQLRTVGQDVWAQSVEQDMRRLREDLKFGQGPDDLREYYKISAEYLAMIGDSVQPSKDFMEELAKLYAESRRHFPR